MGLVKLINNCLSPLPFYDSEEDQYKYKDYAFGHHCPVIIYKNTLLPFQVILNKPVTGLNYVHLHYGYTDKYTIITERMQENGLRFDSYDDFVIMTYPGILPIVDIVYEGQYYLTISIAGLGRIVSEIFTATAHIEPYLLLSYRNSYNFYLKGGMIDFSNNFRFLCYVRSQLGRPDYEFEEESTDRMGYSFIESQVSKKVYNFNAIMPEYLCDALRIVRMCDDKKVYSKGKLYELTNFEMDVDWQDQGDLAAVNCNFETDTVIANIGGYEPEAAGGDFNEDFNEDYDDQQSGGGGSSGGGGGGDTPTPEEVTYTYNTPTGTLLYNTTAAQAGDTITPTSLTYSQTKTGSDGSIEYITSGATSIKYQFSSALSASAYSFDTSAGTLTLNSTSQGRYVGKIAAVVVMNGVQGYIWGSDIYQEATVYSKPIVDSLTYSSVPAEGATTSPTINFYQDWTNEILGTSGRIQGGSNYPSVGESIEYNLEAHSASNISINTSTGAVTLGANVWAENTDCGRVMARITLNGVQGDWSASAIIWQEASEITYTYSDLDGVLQYTNNISADGGEFKPVQFHYKYTKTGNDGSVQTVGDDPDVEVNIYLELAAGMESRDVSIDSQTGVISLTNTSDVRTIGNVYMNLKFKNLDVTIASISNPLVQQGASKSEGWHIPLVTLSYPKINKYGGWVEPEYSIVQYHYDSNGNIDQTKTDGFETAFQILFSLGTSAGVTIDTDTGRVTKSSQNSQYSDLRVADMLLTAVGEGTSTEGESQTITVYQEAMDEVYTPTMSGASTYAMLVESIVNFDPAYIDIYGNLLDDEGNVIQEDVKLFRLGEDSSSSRISTGDTFQGKYESGIEVGYYKLTYCIFRQVGQTGTVKYTFDGGTGRTECPYTMPSSGIPGTTYNTDNIEVRNYNANITLFNISVRMSS